MILPAVLVAISAPNKHPICNTQTIVPFISASRILSFGSIPKYVWKEGAINMPPTTPRSYPYSALQVRRVYHI